MSSPPGGIPRVLHIHGSLAADDPQARRCVRLIEAFGGRLRHTLVAADGAFGALDGIAKGISVERRAAFPPLGGLPLPGRLQRIAREMVDYHLVLTYGRVGIGAALAHTSFSEVLALPPLIHHEDGSDETTAQRRSLRSKWSRRLGLGKAAGVVVPNETMEAVALVEWQQPLGRVKTIPDGVDLERFAKPPPAKGLGRLLKRRGECWIGCFVRHGGGEDLAPLLETVAALDEHWHLVVVGDSPARARAEAAATRLTIDHRAHFVGGMPDHAEAMGLFDIFSVAGGNQPLPFSVIEAMAAGIPVVGLDPAEASSALSADNAALGSEALKQLAWDEYSRKKVGTANREKARAERGAAAMIAAYRRLYASAMKR